MKQISTHESGVRVVTYEMPYMNSVSVGIWVGTGGRNEQDDISGISHFIEHLLFKGTQKRNNVEISQAIEGLGGVLNAFTGEEYTCYLAKVLSEYFDVTFDVLWDMVTNTVFSDKDIEKEKSVIKEEINMYLDLPGQYVHDLLNNLMWPNQPLGRILIGTEQTVDALNNDSIVAYKNQYYQPSNIVIAVAGDIKHDAVYNTVLSYLNVYSSNEDIPPVEPVREDQHSPESFVMQKDTEQTHLALGIRAYPRNHKDRYILKVLNTILGENMSSRLFQTIREDHGLAYSIHSSIERFRDTGALVISAGVEERNLIKCIELIMSELLKLKTQLVSDDELKRAKKYCVGQLSLGLEKTMNIMIWLGENLLCTGDVKEIDEILEGIKQVTATDIQRVCETLFVDQRLNLAVIGPIADSAAVEKVLKVGNNEISSVNSIQ